MTVEVGAKLVLDDAASAALGKIRSGFDSIGERVSHVQHEMAGMLKQAAAVAIGFQFDRGIESLKSLGEEAINAATGSEKQIKNLAGVLALTDKSGMSFEEATGQATGFKEELEKIAIAGGVSADSVIDAFSTIAERSSKTREEVLQLTQEMTTASKALPGGIGQMAGAFQQLESGIVRPRNALVQMMKQTGVVGGTAKEISTGLNKMIQAGQMDKVVKMGEEAIARMAKKMANAPATFEGTIQSLKDIRENLFEAFGMPMIQAITPQLVAFKKYILEHKEKIEEFAKSMGVKVGEWVKMAAAKIQEGFEYVQTHAKEIEEAITKGADMLMQAVKFIIAHKEEIALIYGGSKVVSGVSAGVGMAKSALQFGGKLAGGAGGLEAAGVLASTGALVAFAAAIASVGLAAYNGAELYKQIKHDEKQDNDARIEKAKELAMMTRQLTADEQKFLDRIRKEGVESKGGAEGMAFGAKFDQTLAGRAARMQTVSAVDQSTLTGDTTAFVQAYNEALAAKDTQMLQVLKEDLEQSSILQSQMGLAADKISGGFEKMGEVLGVNESVKERLLMMYGDKAPKPDKVLANFNGPITIKQDFRDQDPDRVAIVFRREMERSASNILGSKT